MNIAAATVSMDAAYSYKEVEQQFTRLSMGAATTASPEQVDSFGLRLATVLASSTQTSLSCRSEVWLPNCGTTTSLMAASQSAGSEVALIRLTEQIIGQSVKIGASQTNSAGPSLAARSATLISGVMYSQEESLLFSAQGSVRTTDGREISFDLGLVMERSTVAATVAALEVSSLFIDPLILQFDVNAPLLMSDSTFLFDLAGDGILEELACPGQGCGFLAFDRNGDGLINNGLELFGPATGFGFAELAELDSDGNMWIDENDPCFDQLLIWSPDGKGGGTLLTLREAGVGAISVLHAGTGFRLDRPDGSVMGTVKANGIFLTEDGEVRPIHEVDLALPGTQPAPGPAAKVEQAASELENALRGLRTIVAMQQLRLRTMLAGARLQSRVARQEDQRQTLIDWLQSRSQWYAQLEDRLRDKASGDNTPLMTRIGQRGPTTTG